MNTQHIRNDALVVKAIKFASEAHEAVNQVRKYTQEPYIVHPLEVLDILLEFASGEVSVEMAAASVLHDVVEDTQVTLDEIEAEFGATVAQLVSDLTDVSRPSDGNRKARKALDLAHTAAADARSKTIKLADLVSNSRSIVQHDPNFARVYVKEKARILEVCSDADPGLLAEAQCVLAESGAMLKQAA